MLYLILICFVVLLIAGPSYWVKHTMEKYSEPANRYSFTGSQLARNLLNDANLHHIGVEVTESGDHYDPLAKKVRLTPDKFNGRSLTAITIAAHEVGHAIQDQDNYAPPCLVYQTDTVGGACGETGCGYPDAGTGDHDAIAVSWDGAAIYCRRHSDAGKHRACARPDPADGVERELCARLA